MPHSSCNRPQRLRLALFALVVAGNAAAADNIDTAREQPVPDDKREAAAPKEDKTIGLTVAATTNYMFRGVSLSNRNPAVQGSFDKSAPLLWGLTGNLGLWASSVRFSSDSNIPQHGRQAAAAPGTVRRETGVYGGLSGDLAAGLTWSAQSSFYRYPGFSSLDWTEQSLTIGRGFDSLPLKPRIEVSGVKFRSIALADSEGTYLETNLKLALVNRFALTLHIGRSRFDDQRVSGNNYVDRAVTLERSFAKFLFEVSYTRTNTEQFGALGRPTALLKVSRTF